MARKNVFDGGIISYLLRLVSVWRLGTLVPDFLKAVFFQRQSARFKDLYYYYMVLLNSEGCHSMELDDRYLFTASGMKVSARKSFPSSDLENFNQIFGREEYFTVIDLYRRHFNGEPRVIFDFGANVGYSCLYFSKYFSSSRIHCVEPDSENFRILEMNCKDNGLENVSLYRTGVWSRNAKLEYSGARELFTSWSFSFRETDDPEGIPAVGFSEFIQEHANGEVVDILKIDIEGTEKVIFDDGSKVHRILQRTKLIALEIHEDIADRNFIEGQLRKAGFALTHVGDMTFGVNSNLSDKAV